jgi:hypothetical protein
VTALSALELPDKLEALLAAMDEEQTTTQSMSESVAAWLREEGYQVDSMPQPESRFYFVVHKPGKVILFIFQPRESPDRLVVRHDERITPEDRNHVLNGDNRQREQFVWDLQTQLCGLGIEFMMDHPIPTKVLMRDDIFSDGLTKDRLFRAIRALETGAGVIALCVGRALGDLSVVKKQPALPKPN